MNVSKASFCNHLAGLLCALVLSVPAQAGSGSMATIEVSPSSLEFGSRMVNTSATQNVTVKNTGKATLTVSSLKTPTGYSASGCTSAVSPDHSCILTVTFRPTSVGTFNGTLQVASNASNGAATVKLSGSGVIPTPQLRVSPTTLIFSGRCSKSDHLGPQTVIARNVGNANLSISTITLTGGGAAAFSEVSSCIGRRIEPGDSCAITVTYVSRSTARQSATLEVVSTGGTGSVKLTGYCQSTASP